MQQLAFLICPALRDEMRALRSGNSNVVLENGRLLGQLAALMPASNRSQPEALHAIAFSIKQMDPADLPIKELLVRTFVEHFQEGATPQELTEKIETIYGRKIGSGSIRPNLARLRNDGFATSPMHSVWMLKPDVLSAISTIFFAGGKTQ